MDIGIPDIGIPDIGIPGIADIGIPGIADIGIPGATDTGGGYPMSVTGIGTGPPTIGVRPISLIVGAEGGKPKPPGVNGGWKTC